ncbi:MAG: recombination regulator RecX [Wenzhouxiangella sp.]|nr:recombination regulator RecX [Wenzhouxiangella sp.]
MGQEAAPARPADVRDAALRLLAQREHSLLELRTKLTRRAWPEALVDDELASLAEQGLQSDQRYAESFIRSRVSRGYGPIRIRAELLERGIDRQLAERSLRASETDWLSVAADWYQRRFGDNSPLDFKEKTRRQQALARRGFDHALVRELLD